MAKKDKQAREREYYKKKAKNKLYIIGAIIAVLLLVGIIILQSTITYTYEEQVTQRPYGGNPDAAVVFTEFADIQCPACGAAHPIVSQLKDNYADSVRFEFRHFPLRQIHPFAYQAAQAAECAHDQGMFWEYLDIAFANQVSLRQSSLINYAGDLGLDTDMFRSCLLSGAKQHYVDADLRDGFALGVSGTPTFFINGERIQPASFSYQAFSAEIERALAMQ
jgi:protein-disulfide isomerase